MADEAWQLTATPPSGDAELIALLVRNSLTRKGREQTAYLTDMAIEIHGLLQHRGWAASSAHDESCSLLEMLFAALDKAQGRPPHRPVERERWASWPDEGRDELQARGSARRGR